MTVGSCGSWRHNLQCQASGLLPDEGTALGTGGFRTVSALGAGEKDGVVREALLIVVLLGSDAVNTDRTKFHQHSLWILIDYTP